MITGSRTGLTRYAGSEIIQNTARDEVRAFVRVVVGQKLASATTNQLDAEHMRELLRRTRQVLAQRLDVVGRHEEKALP